MGDAVPVVLDLVGAVSDEGDEGLLLLVVVVLMMVLGFSVGVVSGSVVVVVFELGFFEREVVMVRFHY